MQAGAQGYRKGNRDQNMDRVRGAEIDADVDVVMKWMPRHQEIRLHVEPGFEISAVEGGR